MKLRTKFQDEDFELGEVADVDIATMPDGRIKASSRAKRSGLHTFFYNTKAEFDADWEDYEEPKVFKSIGTIGSSVHIEMCSVEEAKKAVKKLNAWKRLKDKGFRFNGWIKEHYKGSANITIASFIDKDYDITNELNLLFGGKE